MSKEYEVFISAQWIVCVEVEAHSEEEAKKKALQSPDFNLMLQDVLADRPGIEIEHVEEVENV